MIDYLSKITSLKNLLSKRPNAQVSTLLILMMVTVIIFVMITANIGEVSLKATSLANAADQAALSLGSQLATRSRALWETNDSQIEQCVKSGLFGAILFLVVTALTGNPLLGLIAYGIYTGVTGGMSGNESFWDGFGQGLQDGILISTKIAIGIVSGAISGAAIGSAFPVIGTVVGAVIGAIVGGVIATAGVLYEKNNEFKDRASFFASANKELSGMPEYDQLREGVFLNTLLALSNDPAKEVDTNDADGDGDTSEKIPRFFNLWDQRVEVYDLIVSRMEDLVNNFVNGSLAGFESFLKSTFTDNTNGIPAQFYRQEIDGQDGPTIMLMRYLYENDINHPTVSLGPAMSLIFQPGPDAATLESWETNQCDSDTDSSCVPPQYYDEVDTVIAEMKDFLAAAADVRAQDIKELALTFDTWFPQFYEPDTVDVDTGDTIVNDADYYDRFAEMINGDSSVDPKRYGISYWKGKDVGDADYDPNYGILEPKRLAYAALPRYPLIPALAIDEYGSYTIPIYQTTGGTLPTDGYGNPIYTPKTDGKGNMLVDGDSNVIYETTGGTQTSIPAYIYDWANVDPNIFYFEELTYQPNSVWFSAVKDTLNNLITQIESFKTASQDTYTAMKDAYGSLSGGLDGATLSGYNPVYYTWPDSAGDHTIKVEVGNYKLAEIKTKKKGKWYRRKVCSTLTNYSDDGTRCWVEITRIDPANKNVQSGKTALGRWNPFTAGEDKIIRRGGASYDYGSVALSGIK
mgnify:CR=1 FL=1